LRGSRRERDQSNELSLLANEKVQEELELVDDQIEAFMSSTFFVGPLARRRSLLQWYFAMYQRKLQSA